MDIIKELFIRVINMSLSASFVISAVLVIRLLLKKAPKIYSYLLWILVFIRLVCPFTLRSALSLIPVNQEAIQYHADTFEKITFDTGVTRIDATVNNVIASYAKTPITPAGMSTSQIIVSVMAILWMIGICAISLIAVIRYQKLKRKLRTATIRQEYSTSTYRVFETDWISSPFLLGMLKPRIYLPLTIKEEDCYYVLEHERIHLSRRDYIIKPLCFLVVMLHWFNPLVWISFLLMVKDMELSCDEAVIRKTKEDIRTRYSSALLEVSMHQNGLVLPIAFGESNTKSRIKNILHFKKPTAWVGLAGITIIFIAAFTLMTSDYHANGKLSNKEEPVKTEESTEPNKLLSENRTPYIGNHIKDLTLIGILPAPEGYSYDHIELQTKKEPYELSIYYNSQPGYDIINKATDQEITNAIMLFATIQNMSILNFHISSDSDSTVRTYNRSDFEKTFGELFPYSKTPEKMKELSSLIQYYLIQLPKGTYKI